MPKKYQPSRKPVTTSSRALVEALTRAEEWKAMEALTGPEDLHLEADAIDMDNYIARLGSRPSQTKYWEPGSKFLGNIAGEYLPQTDKTVVQLTAGKKDLSGKKYDKAFDDDTYRHESEHRGLQEILKWVTSLEQNSELEKLRTLLDSTGVQHEIIDPHSGFKKGRALEVRNNLQHLAEYLNYQKGKRDDEGR